MSSSHENYSPQVIQRLSREIQDLVRTPPEGITYVPNDEESITEIHCDVAGPGEDYWGLLIRGPALECGYAFDAISGDIIDYVCRSTV